MLHLMDRWDDFDLWCMMRGIDTVELNSRRLVNLAWASFTEGLDQARLSSLEEEIERAGRGVLFPEERLVEKPSGKKAVPPPGWKSDEANWKAAQAFIGQMSQVKGAMSQQAPVTVATENGSDNGA